MIDSTDGDLISTAELDAGERRAMWDDAERVEAALWRVCYPRVYTDYKPGEYVTPKDVSRNMFTTAKKVEFGYFGDSEKYEIIWASRMAEHRTPIYWVARDLAEAVLHTTPPYALDWYNMHLPHEAIAFMLPKGLVRHKTDGDVAWVSFVRSQKESWINSLARRGPRQWASENGSFCIFAKTDRYLTHWNMPYDVFPTVDLKGISEAILAHEQHIHSSGWLSTPDMNREDTEIGIKATHLVFGLLLLMTRRKELISGGNLERRIPAKKGKEAREFWCPPVIGRNYAIKRVTNRIPGSGGTHASPRYHWVQGHWKDQVYGPGRKSVKEIWIEPYERGIEDETTL